MSNSKSSNIKLALSSIKVFSNDGTIDRQELESLLKIALEDGIIDDDEKFTLGNIFRKVEEWDVTPKVWKRIQEIKEKYGIK